MRPLEYHAGQLEVQLEANTRHVAEKLAGWVGPAGAYAMAADLVLFAFPAPGSDRGQLRVAAVAGEAPLVVQAGPGCLELPAGLAAALQVAQDGDVRVGGLVLSLERAERARINGSVVRREGRLELVAEEAFTLCRKYISPSAALDGSLRVGPRTREPMALDDPWCASVVAGADTAFLASLSPAGAPDIAHRGGPEGFLELDPERGVIAWTEYVGDGVFKSAGNVRATGTATLLVLDLTTGDGLELAGRGQYTNSLARFRPREDPLVRLPQAFPEQGRLELDIETVHRLRGLTHPRRSLPGRRVTSRDTADEQAPR